MDTESLVKEIKQKWYAEQQNEEKKRVCTNEVTQDTWRIPFCRMWWWWIFLSGVFIYFLSFKYSCLLFYGQKNFIFFLLHFPLLNWSQFITKKKNQKTRTWITFFVKGFCANRNRHTDWKDACDGKQSSRKTNMAGVAARKVEPAEIKN